MDLRKLKKLIDLVKESGIEELELTEGEEKVKISARSSIQAPAPVNYLTPQAPAPIIGLTQQASPDNSDNKVLSNDENEKKNNFTNGGNFL